MNPLVIRDYDSDEWLCAGCYVTLPFETDEEIPHRPDCLQLALPRITAALEAAERLCTALGPLEVDVSGKVHVDEDLIWRLQRAMEA
jgi:hypothetical protein